MNKYWNFSVWKAFHNKLYRETLNHDSLLDNGREEFYDVVVKINKDKTFEELPLHYDTRAVVKLEKDRERYVLPAVFIKKLPLNPKTYFKCQLKTSDKRIWTFITEVDSMYIPEDDMDIEFRNFIQNFNPVQHSHPRYYTLIKLITIASKYKGVKCCLCSAPMMGKNANFSILNHITGDLARIQKPTLAKLETICYYNKVVLPDEITSLGRADIRQIEPMVLWIGDNSTEYNKHSMAKNSKLNQVDLTQLSFIFTYNRPCDLADGSKFFDQVWKSQQAFKSRYPQLLLKGKIESVMSNLNQAQSRKIMDQNYSEMAGFAKQYMYWINHLHEHLHHYDRRLLKMNPRHTVNFEGVIDVLDVYCNDQAEFDDWLGFINQCMQDYKDISEMTEFEGEDKR